MAAVEDVQSLPLVITTSDALADYRAPSGDTYTRLEQDDPAHLEYRITLGSRLALALGLPDTHIYHLESLPRGYEVYQYRSRPDSTGTKQRVDHYVYGHPFRKPIRSLEQIAQHCQWLATDATQNRRNCACTACENLLSESGKGRSPSAAHNSNGAGPSNSGDQSGNSSVAASTNTTPTVSTFNNNSSFVVESPSSREPAQLQQPLHSLQSPVRPANNGLLTILREDSAGIYVYRLQELLWFTETNRNWGLGIVENRQVRTGGTQQQSNAYYQIQPLGSPFAVKPPVLIPHGPQLRPYLSWTPPTFTGGPLDCHAQDFLAVDWFRREQEHEDSANVDAAIFMAKNIDGSYSVQHSPTTPSVIERLFFGPECIWRDDYVTLKTHEGILVQVIQRIIPAQPRPPSQTPSSSPPPLFLLQGFTLTLNTDPSFFPDKTWSPARHPRLQKELAFFHSHLPPSSSPAKWTLVEPRSQYGIADVKGRWYGMHEIGHLLGPELLARLESDRALGRVTHASRALNDRGVDSLRPALDGLGRFFPTRRAVSAEAFVAPVGGPAGRHPYSAQALAGNGAALMVSESNLRVYKAE